ncbi:2Fe-2S iron-sulfur cluster binding domain-containing protein [Xanthobacter dioxanivorans]|uniref:2Fe-2S iron-sulfur cluster binding domain-containing protein n=1 Tax=Xanthobacter dioxanivorans TaxID=2528964 RepID=A0A974PQD4_9HYPH|nr:2Fe-2S iron-sulfur cluster-binding protein [Xanthobacter dioxanivorans]QRG07235.1 2Fe-2S iron-sulfur cluster binding domain-containing protein [Xanthobacter dioxanivorans]
MPRITFITADGTKYPIDARVGESVMRNAIINDIPGIDAECGGSRACATCHVFVDEAFWEQAGSPSKEEGELLEFSENTRDNSRLSCQIVVSDALDGLVVHIPDTQR